MPQYRDPIVHRITERLRCAPDNMLITPKARQPTRQEGVLQPVKFIDVVSLMNETSAAAIVDIGFMVGSIITWSRTITLATAGYWYWTHPHYTLTSDYQVVARFRITANNGGGTLDDVIHMNVNGYFLEPYTSP